MTKPTYTEPWGTKKNQFRKPILNNPWQFKTFWHGAALSPVETLCLKTFIDFGHDIELFSYDVPAGVPKDVAIRDASEIYPRNRVFFYSSAPNAGSVAAFANMFRYRVLELEGGCWVDTDVLCLSGTLPGNQIFVVLEEPEQANNAIMRLPPGHAIARVCREHAEAMKAEDLSWGDTGPALLTRVLTEHNLMHLASPVETAYPIHWSEATSLWKPSQTATIKERTRKAPFLHLWNNMLRLNNIDKFASPPTGSYIFELAERHGVDWPTGATYDETTIEKLEELYSCTRRVAQLENRLAGIESSRTYKVTRMLAAVCRGKWVRMRNLMGVAP